MSNQSHYVVMRRESASVGGWTHFKNWDKSEKQGREYCNSANGMVLALWTRGEYERWHGSNIASYYVKSLNEDES